MPQSDRGRSVQPDGCGSCEFLLFVEAEVRRSKPAISCGVEPLADPSRVSSRLVILYTCSLEKFAGSPTPPLAHPCGRAAKALDEAGHTYEINRVKGGSLRPWTWPSRARDRAEVEQLSGQRAVPILVLDNGEVIAGSGQIVSWARANEPAGATSE